ncbi:uncharacterized protein TNCV_578831 [Trichonephila clavipes]|nr:uncharacterized protein TNCV_578831 [Trichonephila clavipes]
MRDGICNWVIVNPDDPDQDNGVNLLKYFIVIIPGQNGNALFTSPQSILLSLGVDFHETRVAAVAEWYRHRIVAGFVTSSSPVPLKTRRVGQRCTLNLSRAETSSRWCGVVVRRGGCQLSHLTMVQNYVVRRQKPSCS